MNFEPTEQQRLLAESASRLAEGPLGFDQRRHFFVPGTTVEEDWAAIAELGVPGLLVDEAQGGLGGGFHDMAAVLEAFGRGLVVEPVIPTAVAATSVLGDLGSPAQQARWLQPLAAGRLRAALAWTEARSRYRLEAIETQAERRGDGFVLNGAKVLVLGGDSAGLLIVPARLDGLIALFLVPAGTDGMAVTPYRLLDLRGAADVRLDRVTLPAEALLGGDAEVAVERAVDRVTAALCIEAVGAMTLLHEITLEQLRSRTVFGRKLGHFQVPQHRLVDMIVGCELARSLALLAADAVDRDAGRPDPMERARAVSAAKVQVGRSARLVGEQAVQLHGAMGITLEHASGAYHKKLTVIDHLCGDIEHHLDRFAEASGY